MEFVLSVPQTEKVFVKCKSIEAVYISDQMSMLGVADQTLKSLKAKTLLYVKFDDVNEWETHGHYAFDKT